MRFVHRKSVAVVYWLLAFGATVAGVIFGAKNANRAAPEFGDGSGASAGSHLLFGLGGAILGGLIVLAVFAAVWLGLWAADRRAHPEDTVDDGEYDTLDDLDEDFERDYDEEYDDTENTDDVEGTDGVETDADSQDRGGSYAHSR